MYLMFTEQRGLFGTERIDASIKVGDFMRSPNKFGWHQRVSRRGKGHKWKYVGLTALPKKAHMEALLLGVQL